jgi:hypothetical protein
MKPVDVLNFFTPSGSYNANSYAFGQDPRQQLDLYVPDTKTIDKPLVVFVYGGAWKMGNRDEYAEDGININYLSRSGTVNIIEYVLADVEYPGYVVIERVYKFLDNYQFVISTGESGRSCDATTYVFTFNSRSENVTGKTMVDGCSELIDSFADGNKLMVKKDGATSVFYNGETK